MKKLFPKKTNKFINFSGDDNKIHYDKKFANNLFFKKPILHGMNVVLSAFEFFLKTINHHVIIDEIEINFKNFCLPNEKLYINFTKNKIEVSGEINVKIEIFYSIKKSKIKSTINGNKNINLLRLYNLKKINNLELLNNCIYLSKLVGTKTPGNGSLIHKMLVKNTEIKNAKLKIENIVKNVKELKYVSSYKIYRVICSKVKKFQTAPLNIKKNKIIANKLYKKKILIFGINSELGSSTLKILQKYNCLINFHSFRLSLNYPIINTKIENLIKYKISSFKPDFIFYFSSPEITNITKNPSLVRKLYESIYINYPKFIMDVIIKKKQNVKFFLPSSIFLNSPDKYPHLAEYINAKTKMEKIFKLKKYNSSMYTIRLPQFKTRSNYNILGFYEGESLNNLKRFINNFINH